MEHVLLSNILANPFQTVVFVGDVKNTLSSIADFFEREFGVHINSHGDVLIHDTDSLTIDAVRDIKEWTETMPQYRAHKLLILAPTIFPHISHNALLKTLEEPSGKTQIILIVQDASILLPTILSRTVAYDFEKKEKEQNHSFLQSAPHERLAFTDVALLLKTGAQKPSKEMVQTFFTTLVHTVSSAPYSGEDKKKARDVMRTVTPYIYDQGASIKMLVEYVCLGLPTLKH